MPRRIVYDFPFKAIILDLDGTTTGKGPGSWASMYYKHNDWTGCNNSELHGGLVCDSRNAIRKLSFSGMNPKSRFKNMGLKLLKYDDSFMATQNRDRYLEDNDSYESISYQADGDPAEGWAVPFVTGHKYKIHFGVWDFPGLDW